MKHITTPEAPAAVGAYSQGVIAHGFLETSGQIALTPAGELVQGDAEDQTHQVMKNLIAILGAAGCGLGDVVKTQIYIADQSFFSGVNRVYAEYFKDIEAFPARECVVASPPVEGAHVEMSMRAAVPYSD